MKHFVTLPPCKITVNFDKSPIFSHLVLLFLQKRFLCVKLQYLVSTYLQLDCLYLKKQIYSETFCYPYLSMYSTSSGRGFLPLVTAVHEISPTCSCMLNPGEEECTIHIRGLISVQIYISLIYSITVRICRFGLLFLDFMKVFN